jgi:hypothetical protein
VVSIDALVLSLLTRRPRRNRARGTIGRVALPPALATSSVTGTQKSKLAGTIRGSYFVIKGKYY